MNWLITHIESLTTIVLALNVFLCACNSKWNWPIGLLGVTMYGLSAWFLWGLYADALLQIFYLVTGVMGWYYWTTGGTDRQELPVTDIGYSEFLTTASALVIITAISGFMLDEYSNSVVPYSDAFTTGVSLFAQYMLMRRKRQAWILWVLANVVYVHIFHTKGLHQLALLYTVFIANAVWGYVNWSRVKKQHELASSNTNLQ